MKDELIKLGLTEKEAKIYLANLKTGSSLVQKIANEARINRTSAYDLLKSLEEKGFVNHYIESGKKSYQATNPKELLNILKERELIFKELIPKLNEIKGNSKKHPKIEIYVGVKGIKSIFENILNESKEFLCLASKDNLLKMFEFYLPHFVKERKKRKIKATIISDSIPMDKTSNYKIIKNDIKTAQWIYNNKIAMISLNKKEPIGIIIKEPYFYETQKMMFELIWDSLK